MIRTAYSPITDSLHVNVEIGISQMIAAASEFEVIKIIEEETIKALSENEELRKELRKFVNKTIRHMPLTKLISVIAPEVLKLATKDKKNEVHVEERKRSR